MTAVPASPTGSGFEADPLVPPAGAPLREWSRRLSDTWQRSWRLVALIVLLTFAAPAIAAAIISESVGAGPVAGGLPLFDTGGFAGRAPSAIGVALLLSLAAAFVSAIGWGAGIWAVTQAAAGLPATLSEALQAGVRRAVPMLGWHLLHLVLIVAGALACLLPGLYVAFAGALFGFAVVYEPGRPALVRSFALVHKGFLLALGRASLLFLGVVVASGAASGINFGLGFQPVGESTGNLVVATAVESLIMVPVYAALLVGLLLVYTQLRAREGPLTTGALWTAANPS